MSDPYGYAKLTENRNAVVLDYRDLRDDEKKLVENLARIPDVYQFSMKAPSHIDQLLGFLGGGGFVLALLIVFTGQILVDFSMKVILAVVAFVVALAFVHGLYLFWRALKIPLSSHITITPVYVIITDQYEIRYWGIWAFTDFLQTHIYVNNIYSTTEIDLLLPHDNAQFNLRGEDKVLPMIATVKTWKAICEEAIARKRWDYLSEHDILRGLSSAKQKASRPEEGDDPDPLWDFFKQFSAKQLAIYAAAAFLISLATVSMAISFDIALKAGKEKQKQEKNLRR